MRTHSPVEVIKAINKKLEFSYRSIETDLARRFRVRGPVIERPCSTGRNSRDTNRSRE